MKKSIAKYRSSILLVIGTILVILSLCLILYDKIELLKSNVFDEVQQEKDREKNNENEEDKTDVVDAETEYVDEEDISTNAAALEEQSKKAQQEQNKIKKEYIGYLEIKKINLKQGLVSKKSYYNNVNYNIQMISTSDYPDKNLGNTILASHSGGGYISFFKNLYKLSLGDEAKIYYKNYIYTYKIVNIYNVPKTGKVVINRNLKKTCLTLITCTYKSKTEQTVYILELTSKVKDGGNK